MPISAFWPAGSSAGGITKVANSTERLALTPSDGDIVIQLDTDTLYEYDGSTLAWVIIGGYGIFVQKSGDTMTGNLLFTSTNGIDSISSGTTTLNIGATNADVINIGNASATVNINGTTNYNNVTNLLVADKLITVNDGGAAASGFSSGIEVEENASATAYVKTSADRNSWTFKAPAQTGVTSLKSGSQDYTIDSSSLTSSAKTVTALDSSGVMALTSTTLTSGSIPFATSGGVLTQANSQLFYSASTNFTGFGTNSPAGKVHISGAISASSWTTNGLGLRLDAATYTNTSSSGTVTVQAGHAIGASTFDSSSAVTVTDASTLYIAGPAAGTGNTTVTRGWGTYLASGFSYFNGGISVGTTVQTNGVVNAANNSTNTAATAVIYATSTQTVSSNGAYVTNGVVGDVTTAASANNTSSNSAKGVSGIARVSGSAGTVSGTVAVNGSIAFTGTNTLTNAYTFRANNVSNSGPGTLTSAYGYMADDQTNATNNYGYFSAVSSGTNKWNFYANGTASNYMAGDLRVGTTSAISSAKVSLSNSGTNAGTTTTYSQTVGTVNSTGSYQYFGSINSSTTAMSSTADNTSSTAGVGCYGLATVSGTGTGTVTGLIGVYAQVTNTSSAVVTTGTGVRVPAAANTGAGSIGTFVGFNCDGQTAATNNYGFRGLIASASNSFNLYMSGTADNHLAGRLLVGTTDTTIAKCAVVGGTTTEVTQVVRGVASQSANLQNWQNSTPTTVASIGINGSLTAGPTSSSAATHAIYGSQTWTTRAITGNLTIDTTTTDMIILANTTSSGIQITMPSHVAGRVIIVKDSGYNCLTNNITIVRAGGTGNIENAAASYIMNSNGESATFVSDGSSWHRI